MATRKPKPKPRAASNSPALADRRIDADEFAVIEHIRSAGLTIAQVFDRLEGPAPKVRSGGFRFKTQHSATIERDGVGLLLDVEIIIADRARWMGLRESRLNVWSSALVGDDLVVGVRIARADEPYFRGADGETEPEPEFTAALNKVGDHLIRWVDSQPWASSVSVNLGENGRFSIDFETDDPPISGGAPWLILEVQPHDSVR
jgi:hypothetical protein